MRLRALAPWILLPPLLGVLLAGWFVTRAVNDERAEMRRLAQASLRSQVLIEATASVTAESTTLMSFGAFTHVPPAMVWLDGANNVWSDIDVAIRLQSLQYTEASGPATIERLNTVGGAAPAVIEVLQQLDSSVLDDLAAGRTAFIDPTPYAEAYSALTTESADSEARSDNAVANLGRTLTRGPFWRDRDFVAFAAALGALAVAAAVVALLRANSLVAATHARLALAETRSERRRHIITSARRMASETESRSVARALTDEARVLVEGEFAGLAVRDGNQLRVITTSGDLHVAPTAAGEGIVGRCIDSGLSTRVVVPSDPFLPGTPGPLAILAAPLVAEGQVFGAIVVASRTASMFDEEDETTLQLLALVAAGAVTSARRYESSVALALRDPLTGLANRRRLDHDLSTAAVTEAQVAFLMVDIDYFKSYNDQHGHQRGDDLLQMVAHAISSAVREGDIVYRYGGEEFSVLLPGADAPTATTVAERIRGAVVATTAGALRPVTVSVGVASQTTPVSPDVLVERADAALYAAKQHGRDRVSIA